MAKRKRQRDEGDRSRPSASNTKKTAKHESKTSNGYMPSTSGTKKAVKHEPSITRRHTRRMTTDAARDAVFHTAELLEKIFEHLSPRRLIVAQRVCRQFRDIVNKSQKLQQELMLKARTDKKWVDEVVESLQADPSDFVVAHNGALFQKVAADRDLQRSDFVDVGEFRTTSCPFNLLPSIFSPRLLKETDSKKSWHNMQLSSPPAIAARMEIDVRVGPDVIRASYWFRSKEPLTLGTIMRDVCHSQSTRRNSCITSARAYCGERHFQRYTFTLRGLVQRLEHQYGIKGVVHNPPTIWIVSCLSPAGEESDGAVERSD